jgi:uncharacterized protein (TIGR02099 family)
MNQTPAPPAPVKPLHTSYSLITRWLLWVVLAAWALFALTWGALHLWIVPRIGDWRPDLERWATEAVGVPVKVGEIRAEAEGTDGAATGFLVSLMPTLELRDVRLYDPAGREALLLSKVRASVSVTSLWRKGFEQLVIERPVLDIRRTARGDIEIAGLSLSGPQQDHRAADWFFSQSELAIRDGTVRWTDELRPQAPTLTLDKVGFVALNGLRRHQLRLDATPPPEWGEPFNLMASLDEPLLDLNTSKPTPWHDWSGEIYANFPKIEVSRLGRHADLSQWGAQVRAGQGRLQAWADLKGGQWTGLTTDLDWQQVAVRLGADLPELALATLKGRIALTWDAQVLDIRTDNLRLQTADGLTWPEGRLTLNHRHATPQQAATTRLEAQRLELAALAELAGRVPLPAATRQMLTDLRPTGRLENLDLSWQGPATADAAVAAKALPTVYAAKGRAVQLALRALPPSAAPSADGSLVLGRPGLRGASADFDLNQDGGTARVSIDNGFLDLPGFFEQAQVPLTSLRAQARWAFDGERIDAWLDNLSLSNDDAAGTARLHWHTSDPARSRAASRFPGVLDLDARLTRAAAAQVHRYLPRVVSTDARRYVREALRSGGADRIDLVIKGDLWDLPFHQKGASGDFRIEADLRGVEVNYLPAHLQTPGEPPWPALKGAEGRFTLERDTLRVDKLKATVAGLAGTHLSEGSVTVKGLMDVPTMTVGLLTQGSASDVLGFVTASPVNEMLGRSLSDTTGTGQVGLELKLQMPLDKPEVLSLNGKVQLNGNDLLIAPDTPLLERSQGAITFTESGFKLVGTQARVYGGDMLIEGGMLPETRTSPSRIEFRAQGTASAQGIRDGDLGFVSRVFAQASGSATYRARLAFRGGAPELQITSDLQGMALALPAPLGKRAEDSLALRYDNAVLGVQGEPGKERARNDRLALDLGPPAQPLLSLAYERDITGKEPRVLRGSLAVGLPAGESAPVPEQGVRAHLRVDDIDIDAWTRVFDAVSGAPADSASATAGASYLPTVLAARAARVTVDGRSFHRVVLGGSRDQTLWRGNVQANELDGYIEYRQPAAGNAGSVYARLARLNLEPAAAADVEQLLQQPSSVPALDITVQDFVLSGRALGLVDIQAVNRGTGRSREWLLNKLNIRVPEARLNAKGQWAAGDSGNALRRTHLDFRLDIDDSGQLLSRFGRAGVVRGGSGHIEGAIAWQGSPIALDYPSLSGELSTNINAGQFLKVDPGAAKLLGVLSLQSLPRRLTLDFRDVFSEGFAFDFIRGDATIEQGVARTNNLQMKGINAAVLMAGSADIARELQDLQVVVVPELNAGTASLIATAINPAVGLGTFLAQFLLREPLQSATTQEFHISGSWADPKVERVAKPAAKATPAPPGPGR